MRVSSPFVGRDAELEILDGATSALSARDGGALAVSGPAGIGKSRLLAELTDRAGAAEHLVLSGSASEMERDLPFGVLVDALDDHLDHLEPHRLSRLEDGVRVELARVFPSLSALPTTGVAAAQDERYRTHRAIRSLLETLATRPLVVILDDVHWADPASLELIGALLRRPPEGAVLLVLGFRPWQNSERLATELARAERKGTLARVELEPLPRAAADELLGAGVPPALRSALFAESGGVPFYLEQLARSSSAARSGNAADGPVTAAVPPLVLASLSEELASLTGSSRDVLQGAAVAGDPFEPELAAAAAGVTEAEALEALDGLFDADLVRATAVPRRFRFRHPLVRRAVYESAPGAWRITAHERCAAALLRRGASAEVRAEHVDSSAKQGDEEAAALLLDAGRRTADRAPETAARWFAGALRLLPGDAAPAARIEILVERARSLAAVGRLHDSHAALVESVDLAADADTPTRAHLIALRARSARHIGLHEEANQQLLEALGEVPPESAERVVLLLELAFDGFFRVALGPMQEWADEALADAERRGDPALVAAAYAMQTLAGAWTGNVETAAAVIAKTTDLVDRLTDAQLATRLDAASNLTAAELYMDMFPEGRRHAERVFAIGRATNQSQFFPAMYAVRGTSLWITGRLREAAELFDGAIEASRIVDDVQGVAWMLFNRCAVAVHEGDLDGALGFIGESLQLTADGEESLISTLGSVCSGMALLEAGDPARAVEHFLRAGGEELSVVAGGWRAVYHEALSRARVESGDLAGARRSAGYARSWAEQVDLPLARCASARAFARLELVDGRPREAAELALRSAAAGDSAGAQLESARSRVLAGRAFGEAGDRDRGIDELSRAAADFGRF